MALVGMGVWGISALGCGSADVAVDETLPPEDDGAYIEDALSAADAEVVCRAIPNVKPWTTEESDALLREVVQRFADRKRTNDQLIRTRGVGRVVGERTPLWRAISAGNKTEARRIIAASLRAGNNADTVLAEIKPTSCVGAVYAVLGEAYTAIGRGDEWKKILACGKAYGSVGIAVQRALIRNGWPSPALAFVTDVASPPGNADARAYATQVARYQANGTPYYNLGLSKSAFLRDFLPTPGSRTVENRELLRTLGAGNFLSVATIRAAYHVPFVVPAAVVPDDLAPSSGPERAAWNAAKAAGEPFVLESHSARNATDRTNFEVKPFTAALSMTFRDSVVYSSGTLLFSPNSSYVPGP